jgi:hypothetical protein
VTGRDLVTASLRLIGAIAPGESLEASEATDGLASINRMLDSWSNEGLLIYSNAKETFTLTPGTQSYTMGPSGNFNTTRPQKIEQVLLQINTTPVSTEYQCEILSLDEWTRILQKQISTPYPNSVYINYSYPLATLEFYPVPSVAYGLVIYSWKTLSRITGLDTTISLPPGYEEALIYNGSIRLAPEYGKTVSQEVAMVATDSKAAIKRINFEPAYLRCDDGMVKAGRFNILTGGYGR